jgi:hypothetical protein
MKFFVIFVDLMLSSLVCLICFWEKINNSQLHFQIKLSDKVIHFVIELSLQNAYNTGCWICSIFEYQCEHRKLDQNLLSWNSCECVFVPSALWWIFAPHHSQNNVNSIFYLLYFITVIDSDLMQFFILFSCYKAFINPFLGK